QPRSSPPFPSTTLFRSQTQGMVLRAAELPGLIRQALRVFDVGQAAALGAELEGVLAALAPGLVPADKLRACYQALYDAEAAKVRSEEHTSELQSRGHLV